MERLYLAIMCGGSQKGNSNELPFWLPPHMIASQKGNSNELLNCMLGYSHLKTYIISPDL